MTKPGTPDKGGEGTAPRAGERLSEAELAGDIMGKNRLQGDDQESVRNERQAQPDAKLEPDADPVESARMLDKDARARAELGKGNRSQGERRSGDGET